MDYEWEIEWPGGVPDSRCSLNLIVLDNYEGPIIRAVNKRTGEERDFYAAPGTREISWRELGEFSGGSPLRILPYMQLPGYAPAPKPAHAPALPDEPEPSDYAIITPGLTDELKELIEPIARADVGDLAVIPVDMFKGSLSETRYCIVLVTEVSPKGHVRGFQSIPAGRMFHRKPDTCWVAKSWLVDREAAMAAILKLHPARRSFPSIESAESFLEPFRLAISQPA